MKTETVTQAVRKEPLPFCRPTLDEREEQAVLEVLRSGWLTSGPQVKALEQEFAEYVGASEAIALTSCTAGQHLVLAALDLQPGDEVIVPSMTWPSTVNTIVLSGGRPVFADIRAETVDLDPESVAARVSPRTRAIIGVHFAGRAFDVPALEAIAGQAQVPLIHDAAHAAGTEWGGGRIGGGPGGPSVFSFHPIKNMTSGEGGMITTNDADLAARLRRLRFHGIERDAWSRYGSKGAAQYAVVEPGFKYNLPDVLAAIGRVQLSKLDGFIAARQRLAELYDEALADVEAVVRPPLAVAAGERHAWHLYTIQLRPERMPCDRDELMSRLQARGISTGLHFNAVHLHPYYRERYGCREGDLPNTEAVGERIVSLPLFPSLSEADVESVVTALKEVLRGDG